MAAATENFSPIGSSVFLCQDAPATYNAAGYAALDWIEIGEVDSVGEFGPESATQTRTSLKTGIVRKRKGPRNFGAIPLTLAMAPGDEGQQALIEAEADKDAWSVKVLYGDGTIEYTRGFVMSYKRNIGGAENGTTMASANIEIDRELTVVYPT